MGHHTYKVYKVFKLYFSIRCETYNSHLHKRYITPIYSFVWINFPTNFSYFTTLITQYFLQFQYRKLQQSPKSQRAICEKQNKARIFSHKGKFLTFLFLSQSFKNLIFFTLKDLYLKTHLQISIFFSIEEDGCN